VSILVQKYGGSSLSDLDRVEAVADQIAEERRQGTDMVVVVSAMGDTTDELLGMAKQLADAPSRRELDMLLSVGERITMSLLSIALQDRGIEAVSLTGSQCGIITTHDHSNARIMDVRPFRVQDELAMGNVVIVAGYQGTSYRREVTTLGRGGSDTTAVALAAALDAKACDIFSDVDGVFSADPEVVVSAEKLEELTHDEMLEMARSGARILCEEAVEYARRADIALYARQAHGSSDGTVVRTGGFQQRIERAEDGRPAVSVSHIGRGLWVTCRDASDEWPGALGDRPLSVLQWAQEGGRAFVDPEGLGELEGVADSIRQALPEANVTEAGLVTVVGSGIGRRGRWMQRGQRALSSVSVEPIGTDVQSDRLSWIVGVEDVEAAARTLHQGFVESGSSVAESR
jgi:aspartate kinase